MNTKQLSALSIIIAAASFQANAIVDGTVVSKEDFQQFVEMGCTGNIIAGKYVLTAAHCAANLGMRDVVRYDGSVAKTKRQINHPSFNEPFFDIGFWELETRQAVNKINTISIANVPAGQPITVYGFGGTAPQLSRGVQTSEAVSGNAHWLRTFRIGQGNSTGGDSGASYLNSAGEIVAVHNGGSSTSTLGMEGFRVEYAKQFILDTVNGWHYPTNINASGVTSIKVQSLHVGGVSDAAYTEGDLTIDYGASNCDDAVLNEFDTCTYVVNTSGGHGKLFLSPSEFIEVNKPKPVVTPPVTNPNGSGNAGSGSGGSGGSFGIASLIALLGFGLFRNRRVIK